MPETGTHQPIPRLGTMRDYPLIAECAECHRPISKPAPDITWLHVSAPEGGSLADRLASLSRSAADEALAACRRGDDAGNMYGKGLRDAYATAAMLARKEHDHHD